MSDKGDKVQCADCGREIPFSASRILSVNAALNGGNFETACHCYLCIECCRKIISRQGRFLITPAYGRRVICGVCDDLSWVGMTEKVLVTEGGTRNRFKFILKAHRADLSSEPRSETRQRKERPKWVIWQTSRTRSFRSSR